MAKHFRVEEPQSTAKMQRTRRSGQVIRDDTAEQVGMPYGQAAEYHYSYPSPVPRDDYYVNEQDVPARGGIRMVGRGLLLFIAWIVRACALVMFFLVLLNALSISPIRVYVTQATDYLTSYMPWRNITTLSLDTPFGGFFRGDMAIITLLLFILDWQLCRLRASLR